MAISLCSGTLWWHRDHDDMSVTITRSTGPHDALMPSEVVAVLPIGTSTTFEDAGVKITIGNDPMA